MADNPYVFVFCELGRAETSRKVAPDQVDARRRDCAAWLSSTRTVRIIHDGRLAQELRAGETLLSISEEHLLAGCLAHELGRRPTADELSAAKRYLATPQDTGYALRNVIDQYLTLSTQAPTVDFAAVDVQRLGRALGLQPRVTITGRVGNEVTGKVPSTAGGSYVVSLHEKPVCQCEDYQGGELWCKHAIALALAATQ